ncbi:oligosaccharide flippase family protein [Candidatus Roizmanbacteria bacterium]|nr:oligosaccharide flippase family protein [Candidatus Roizmanbacteria bacterium]
MEELDIATVTKRSIRGVFALVSRTFFIQLISLAVITVLYALLKESEIGVFYLVSASIAFLSYFSDIGLAAALIQKKEALTDSDLKTTFTIQQGLVVSVVIIALLLSNVVGNIYKLNLDGVHLFQALVFSFFLSSLKTIPSIILERNLRFDKLVIPQIVETIVFNLIVLVLALKGFGINSYTYAVLARGLIGLITIYLIAPWRIGLGFSKDIAKKLLSFGIPFQSNSVLALLKDDLLILYLGTVLPFAQLGYIGFAQKWAYTPLRLIMDNMIRITFPSFSRLAHDMQSLGKAIEKSLFATVALIFPALTGLVILAPYFIHYIPKYQKWEPAILSLGFFAINAALSSISTPLTNALNAIGKVKITLYLMVFWTLATWILTPLAIFSFGFNGVAVASAVISLSVIGVIYLVRRYVKFDLWGIITTPAIATLIMGIVIYYLSRLLIGNLVMIFVMIGIGMILYFGVMFFLGRKQIIEDSRSIILNLKK